jgi:hypothetical protein
MQSKVVMSLLSLFVTSLCQIAAQQPEYGTTLQFFPQIAMDGGYTTSFLIHNPTSESISVKVELFQSDGRALDSAIVMVEAKQSQTKDFGGSGGNPVIGWAKLSSKSPFAATELFQIRSGGRLIDQVGVLPSTATKAFRIFGVSNSKVRTGVAIANPNDTAVTVTVRRLSGGSAVDIKLDGFQQMARFLDQIFSEPAPADNVVEFSANQPIAGVTLILNEDQLSALPVITEEGVPADGSVSGPKIADSTVVRSLIIKNEKGADVRLQDNILLTGKDIKLSAPKPSPNSIPSPLSILNIELADESVSKSKIPDSTVVRSLLIKNEKGADVPLQDNVRLTGGTGIKLSSTDPPPNSPPNSSSTLNIESLLRVADDALELVNVIKDKDGNLIPGERIGRPKEGDVVLTIKDKSLVRSVNGLSDVVSILQGDNINIRAANNAITISAPPAVRELKIGNDVNGLSGTVSLLGSNDITVTKEIDKNALRISTPPAVRAINGLTGSLSIFGGPGVAVAQEPNKPEITISSSGVRSLNGVRGDVSVVGGGNIAITQDQTSNKLIVSSTGGGGGLSLPFAGSAVSPQPAFQVINSGTGPAASFTLDNPSANLPGLLLNSTGSGPALQARTSGTSGAAFFASTNPARTAPIVFISDDNAGAGEATLMVQANNPMGVPAVRIQGGPGPALSVRGTARFAGNVNAGGQLSVDQDMFVGGRLESIVQPGQTISTFHIDPTGFAQFTKMRTGSILVDGDATIGGTLTKASGSFRIDHPLDPTNKYLSHSFVESPDMMNIYNGNIRLDQNGEAWIDLPAWFEALNRDFRYQLTALGVPCPNLYISEEVSNNRFKIAGGAAGAKVSWQVTGIRHDAHANARRIQVEEEKPESERGKYSTP